MILRCDTKAELVGMIWSYLDVFKRASDKMAKLEDKGFLWLSSFS
jgi:hypothetical protein